MWLIDNRTPYAAERAWVLDRDGRKHWVVAVKGTFAITTDGATHVAHEQEEPRIVPLDAGEPGRSSVLYESDLTPAKPTTDVVMNAVAHAPGGHPATEVRVSMSIGGLKKELLVTGDRVWSVGMMGAAATSPRPFVELPIVWERAFGGMDTIDPDPVRHGYEPRNPVGTSFATDAKHLQGRPLPNVEYPNDRMTSWRDRPRPAGFGVIASYWMPRRQWAGTYDEKWQSGRAPLWPTDFDPRFFQCSPEDQRPPTHLRGGERVELQNLSASGMLSFTLPKVYLGFTTLVGGKPRDHRGVLHTVILEPERKRVVLVWHTSLECHREMEQLERTIVQEKDLLE